MSRTYVIRAVHPAHVRSTTLTLRGVVAAGACVDSVAAVHCHQGGAALEGGGGAVGKLRRQAAHAAQAAAQAAQGAPRLDR
eukprot:37780-Prymnesium_polylepis.1